MLAGFRGERAPAWLARDGSRYTRAGARTGAEQAPGIATRELEVEQVIRETDSAVSLVLGDPSGAPLPARRAGQFFTVLVDVQGETLRRAYSISSDCRDPARSSLTIKRVAGGRVSNHLNDHARVGQRLRVLGPSGEFGARLGSSKLVLIAGGSGITPMMALIRTLLPSQPACQIALIYANRSADQVIFAAALAALEAEQPGRLSVAQTLEQPPAGWTGARGPCDRPTLTGLLDAVALAGDPQAEFLLCGPAPMMSLARELLRERGVAAARIHAESFLAPRLDAAASASLREPQPLTVLIGGREEAVVVQPGQTLLEAGLAAGLALPYSCAMGGCAACKVELEQGAVIMREPNCLSPRERAAGYVLACVANPSEPCRVRVPS